MSYTYENKNSTFFMSRRNAYYLFHQKPPLTATLPKLDS